MRFSIVGTNLRILLEGDEKPYKWNFGPEIETQQHGVTVNGTVFWSDPEPVSHDAGVVLDRLPEVDERAVVENNEVHPLDLYTVPETESETEISGSEEETVRRSTLRLKRSRAEPNLWKFFGTGTHSWVNGLKVNLYGLNKRQQKRHIDILKGVRKMWNQNKQLVPVVENRSDIAEIRRLEPNCIFKYVDNRLTVTIENHVEFKQIGSSRWNLESQENENRNVFIDLKTHPRKRKHVKTMATMANMWNCGERYIPLVQHGINKTSEGTWSKKDPEDPDSAYILKPWGPEDDEEMPSATATSPSTSTSSEFEPSSSTTSSDDSDDWEPTPKKYRTLSPAKTSSSKSGQSYYLNRKSSPDFVDLTDSPPVEIIPEGPNGELFPVLSSNFDLLQPSTPGGSMPFFPLTDDHYYVVTSSEETNRGVSATNSNMSSQKEPVTMSQTTNAISDVLSRAIEEAKIPLVDQLREDWLTDTDDEMI